jgi:hypothetical protein
MAITTMDGVIAGQQPPQHFAKAYLANSATNSRYQSLWGIAGAPGVGTYNTTLNGGTYSSSGGLVGGQLPHTDPGAGVNSYLSRLAVFGLPSGGSTSAIEVLLCDRLWDNGGINVTITTAQSITSPTWPARDINGATLGSGVLLAVEVSAAVGAGTPTLTLSYTNSAGTSGRTGTNTEVTAASAAAAAWYPIGLQAGDIGVQSVQSLTLSATWTSGTINVVAYRVLAATWANSSAAIDCITGGFPRLYNGVVPFLIARQQVNGNFQLITGSYTETQG